MALSIGTQPGSHEIIALLGKGGMGEVYRARDTKLKRDVAIKVLPDEFSRDGDRVSRFQREAEVLASMNHPNLAAIYSLGEYDGQPFIVMELLEGHTLRSSAEGPRLSADRVVMYCQYTIPFAANKSSLSPATSKPLLDQIQRAS